jgi:hypothetical protein
MNVEKTKVMRISRQPSPVTIVIDQKQEENVECFKYLGSMLTNEGRCTCEIKSSIAMAKVAFNKEKNLFTSKLDIIQIVKYADDLVLMTKEEKVLQDMIDKLIEIGKCYGMEMNVEKTK